jgi:hypothetical protein
MDLEKSTLVVNLLQASELQLRTLRFESLTYAAQCLCSLTPACLLPSTHSAVLVHVASRIGRHRASQPLARGL